MQSFPVSKRTSFVIVCSTFSHWRTVPVIVDYNIGCHIDGFHITFDNEITGLDGTTVYSGFNIKKQVDSRWTLDDPYAKEPHFCA